MFNRSKNTACIKWTDALYSPCFPRRAADSSAMMAPKESWWRERRCSILASCLYFYALSAIIRDSHALFFVFSKTRSAFNLCSSSNMALFSRRNASNPENSASTYKFDEACRYNLQLVVLTFAAKLDVENLPLRQCHF